MRIIFERSGGIMGLKSNLVIDLDDLPADQSKSLRKLLDDADFFALPENPPARSNPDGFQYTLTVETDNARHTIHATDTTIPITLRPLIDELSQRARTRRKG